MRSAIAALIGVAASMVVVASPALGVPTPSGPSGPNAAGFGIQSASHGRPDARGYLTYNATPGARVNDQVAVVNLGTKPIDLKIYATDATTGADGGFALLNRGQQPKQVGTWLTLQNSGTVHVAARTKNGPSFTIVGFSLQIPVNVQPGDHAGGIVVSLTTQVKNSKGVLVNLDQRVGLRTYIRINGDLKAALKIEHLRVSFAGPALVGNPFGGGALTLDYEVHNTGNVLLGAVQSATITSWLGGDTHVKGLPLIPPLLPGASVAVHRVVKGIFPGLHITATVHLDPVAPPQSGQDPLLSAVSASSSVWAFPWALLILILVVFGGGGGFWWWRRRRLPTPSTARTSHRPAAVLERTSVGK